jgi:YHS domain-containing protein
MKKKTVNKAEKQKPTKKKWGDVVITIFTIVLFGGAFVWMFLSIYNQEKADAKADAAYRASLPALSDTIPHSKVCMVDDVFQGDYPTLATSVGRKTYYGCSAKATRDLVAMDSLRTAIDPISKVKVDKASAIIAIHPDKDGKVMYFRSKETFSKYLGALKRKSGK